MNHSHNKALYDELFLKIARMHDEVDYRKHLNAYQGQSGKRKRYPCVSVGAELFGVSAVGHHHNISRISDFHPLVSWELELRLGRLNETSINYPSCKNKVGHCAENYAVSEVLNRIDNYRLNNANRILSQFSFTKAFQPRTWKNIDWCENCHTMYD